MGVKVGVGAGVSVGGCVSVGANVCAGVAVQANAISTTMDSRTCMTGFGRLLIFCISIIVNLKT